MRTWGVILLFLHSSCHKSIESIYSSCGILLLVARGKDGGGIAWMRLNVAFYSTNKMGRTDLGRNLGIPIWTVRVLSAHGFDPQSSLLLVTIWKDPKLQVWLSCRVIVTVDNTAIVSLPGLDPLGGNFVFVLCFPFFRFMCMPKKIIMILDHNYIDS